MYQIPNDDTADPGSKLDRGLLELAGYDVGGSDISFTLMEIKLGRPPSGIDLGPVGGLRLTCTASPQADHLPMAATASPRGGSCPAAVRPWRANRHSPQAGHAAVRRQRLLPVIQIRFLG
jgi:hypothetical protein